MSWMVCVLGGSKRPCVDGPVAPDLAVLGNLEQIRQQISQHLPGVCWVSPDWGQYAGNGFTFEFGIGREDPVTSFAVYIRGGGNPLADLQLLAIPNGWHLLDGSTGEFIEPDSTGCESWNRWQAYRDKIRGLGGESDLTSDKST